MLQRLFINSGKVLIWGESGGALNSMKDAYEAYEQMLGDGNKKFRKGYGGNGKKQFDKFMKGSSDPSQMWIACMNPSIEITEAAFKAFFEELYIKPLLNTPYCHWGIKDVLADMETAKWLKMIFPEAKFLFLIRNPMDCLLSIKRRNWMDKNGTFAALRYYTHHWKRLAQDYRKSNFGKLVYYEKIINDRLVIEELMDYTGITGLEFDFISKSKVDWKPDHDRKLNFLERYYIRKTLSEEAMLHGYKI